MVAQSIDRGLPSDRHADELERLLSLASTFQALQRLKPVRWSTEPQSELDLPPKPKLPRA